MISKEDLLKKVALLESLNDQLSMELKYVDNLLKKVGFSHGLESVKDASQEIVDAYSEFEDEEDRS
jgi:hypothetical protein